jgi:uncharacterized protein YpiB (UPF0302 family)
MQYILNQSEHHKKVTFADEYENLHEALSKNSKVGNKGIRFLKRESSGY